MNDFHPKNNRKIKFTDNSLYGVLDIDAHDDLRAMIARQLHANVDSMQAYF